MKILYAVQATGNGHISRAMELLPHLKQYGEVDIFLSGDNSSLPLDAPVKYRSKGLSLYYNCRGGLDYWQIARSFRPAGLRKEIRELPVENYQLVINDFEYITAAACARKKVPSVNFGHQASFYSAHTPRPATKSYVGEWVLKQYAPATRYIGLHFQPYDDFIFPPIIKKAILEAEPDDQGYVTVYLPSLCEKPLLEILKPLADIRFEVFCHETKQPFRQDNILFLPVERNRFNHSLIHCNGIITGAGFETPAEALYLGKKLLCIPIKGQYEQQCNAAALRQMGVPCLEKMNGDFSKQVIHWLAAPPPPPVQYSGSTQQCLDYLFSDNKPPVRAVTPPSAAAC